MEMKNCDRYEGRKIRGMIFKELNEDVSLSRLMTIFKCEDMDYLDIAMKKLENEGYVEGNPVGTALCWGCKWAYGQKDKAGNYCSWARMLKPRKEWIKDENYTISIRDPETGEEGLCVKKCEGFDLNSYVIEKKYIISILLKFFSQINETAFTKTFFVKANASVFNSWLKLFNDFRELIDFDPFVIAEPETYDDLTEEDYEIVDNLN